MAEYYVGLNLQPDNSNNKFEVGLNVFGIIKYGPSFDTTNHFFEVQRIIPLMETYDSLNVTTAKIELTRITPNNETLIYSNLTEKNNLYSDQGIVTQPADKWLFTCKYDTFEVQAQCIVPNVPTLIDKPLVLGQNNVEFTIKSDTTAFLYHVYLIDGSKIYTEKKVPQKGINTTFNVKTAWEITPKNTMIYVFAYDINLEKYLTTSNTFFKPNAFRPSFSTVNGGYGTFGAMCSMVVAID